jgi:hypothetical protein
VDAQGDTTKVDDVVMGGAAAVGMDAGTIQDLNHGSSDRVNLRLRQLTKG